MSVTDDSGRVGESLEFGWQLIDPGRSVKILAIFFSYVCPALMVKAALQSKPNPPVDSFFLLRNAQKQKRNRENNWCVRVRSLDARLWRAYTPLKLSQLQKLGCGIAQLLWHRVIESGAGCCLPIGSAVFPPSCAPGEVVVKPSLQPRAPVRTYLKVFSLDLHLPVLWVNMQLWRAFRACM